ncbi:DUF1266 domain-containing protein [Zafaria sp. Z1313]|uniref:DUF1266 domain-containing protein n=1 Tax=Zafaria sp. Z1313 TaxID=3423202 RepID=UPI003D301F6D
MGAFPRDGITWPPPAVSPSAPAAASSAAPSVDPTATPSLDPTTPAILPAPTDAPLIGDSLQAQPPWLAVIVLGLVFALTALGIARWIVEKARARNGRADLDAHHTVHWDGDPSAYSPGSPGPLDWPLAAGAVFSICQGSPWNRLRSTAVEQCRAGLVEAWGVRTRAELLATLHWLLTEGHRYPYGNQRDAWLALDPAAARAEEERLTGLAAGPDGRGSPAGAEELWRFRRVRARSRGIDRADFTAWDLLRLVMLARSGATVGHLSDDEARDLLLMVAPELRAAYTGWTDLGGQFMLARWYWNGMGGEAGRASDVHDAHALTALQAPPAGPWARVPWEAPSPPSRLMLVDALLAEELITPLTASEAADAGPWELALDAAVNERLGRHRQW